MVAHEMELGVEVLHPSLEDSCRWRRGAGGTVRDAPDRFTSL
eukprot:CAMPEP_0118634074 /NCGR_PEP_ID=MMETSP0785-20121206/1343_1 /TAXON_ID=91992 /ORGANISM="Bolidomonas pacifica, Strain CCMP 1866" /LENGTH=41 /DNA_ID= /DNA_START= /DNA_END= /DNA_ORIENTATION=